MFNIPFLHKIRNHELNTIVSVLPKGARILEIGGGTGLQAKQLSELGFKVETIDLPQSTYSEDRVFPVKEYDGKNIPFPDDSFDVVFSSNVLEHIFDLDGIFSEFIRVLKPDGINVHIMPTGTWRFWTNVTNYLEFIQRLLLSFGILIPRSFNPGEIRRLYLWARQVIALVVTYAIPPRHGEIGSSVSEIYTFSSAWWLRKFEHSELNLESMKPMGLFYTGHMFLGARWKLESREKWAAILGSSCNMYILQITKLKS